MENLNRPILRSVFSEEYVTLMFSLKVTNPGIFHQHTTKQMDRHSQLYFQAVSFIA